MSPSPSAGSASAVQVSLLMVARNTAPFIGAALRSARAQSFADIEIIVVDDGSTDETRTIALAHAAQDPRVRVIDGPRIGLAAVRNASLAAARGRWAAILDSDDLLHFRHIERLVAEARVSRAEIVAANMVSFAITQGVAQTALFAKTPPWRVAREVGLAEYVRANSAFGDPVCAGYLKPLLDLAFLRRHDLAYDPHLRIAEDYDLVARMMARGARFAYLPRPTYFYRRHGASTSHRQSETDLSAMLAAADAVLGSGSTADLRSAVAQRKAGIGTSLRHTRAIGHLKARNPGAALRALGRDWRAWSLLAASAWEGVGRRLASRPQPRPASAPVALVIGTVERGTALHAQIAQLAAAGTKIVTRPPPVDDAARAMLVNGLPALKASFIAPPASADDGGYAIVHADGAMAAPLETAGREAPPMSSAAPPDGAFSHAMPGPA
ncbi:glycosyltransferase family 2 protein [Novosphingobium sp. BL-8H]|uniref:glycosyltransferase family 2 protein n=1 Tax=Novosphingobium sp. BL-8H TaxID=3127640 RepID=UPI0037577912